MLEQIRTDVNRIIGPYTEDHGIEIIETNVRRKGRITAIQIIVDRPCKINIDECADLNRFLVSRLDEEELMGSDYTIEVSSPGLDRPLRTPRDFARVIGEEVRFHLTEKVNGKCEYSGTVEDVRDGSIEITGKHGKLSIDINLISKAVLQVL